MNLPITFPFMILASHRQTFQYTLAKNRWNPIQDTQASKQASLVHLEAQLAWRVGRIRISEILDIFEKMNYVFLLLLLSMSIIYSSHISWCSEGIFQKLKVNIGVGFFLKSHIFAKQVIRSCATEARDWTSLEPFERFSSWGNVSYPVKGEIYVSSLYIKTLQTQYLML